MAVGHAAVLDVGQFLAQRQGHRAGRRGEIADREVLALQLADRGHHGGGAAGEDLGDLARGHALAPFVDAHLALDHVHAAIACQLQDAVAGDALEDAAGQRRGDQAAVAHHQEHVHAAQLFQVLALDRVQEQHLRAALRLRLLLRQQRGGVVAAALGRAGAALGRARIVGGQPDRHRRHALGEVGTGRAGDDVVASLLRRAHAQERLVGDHEGAEVQAGLRRRRHPRGIDRDQLPQRFDEQVHRQLRQRQALRRALQAPAVGVRAEGPDRTVGMAVGLDALEDLLAVVQHRGGRIQRQRAVGADLGIVPALLAVPFDGDHVVGEGVAEARRGENLRALVGAARGGGRDQAELRRRLGSGHRGFLW